MPERAAALRDLCADAPFARLARAEQESVLDRCLAYGGGLGDDFRARHGGFVSASWLSGVVASHGVQVEEIAGDTKLPFLAEYQASGSRVELYLHRIREVEAALLAVNAGFFAAASLKDMCLAHEFFHHLECRHFGGIGRIAGSGGKRFGLFPRRRPLPAGSEVAAHVFVQRWFALNFSPRAFRTIVEDLAKRG